MRVFQRNFRGRAAGGQTVHSIWDGYEADRTFRAADEILGVDYDTSRTQELRVEARTQAVAAATAKAALYAEAAGVTLGPVVHVEDVDHNSAPVPMYRLAASAADGGSTDFAPGQLTVAASVALGFSITH